MVNDMNQLITEQEAPPLAGVLDRVRANAEQTKNRHEVASPVWLRDERLEAAYKDREDLLALLDLALESGSQMVRHFRDGTDSANPESNQHVANSNRAFGADSSLDAVRETLETGKLHWTPGQYIS